MGKTKHPWYVSHYDSAKGVMLANGTAEDKIVQMDKLELK
jgi:hypothetical protein